MAGRRGMIDEALRNQVMESLFGEQSEYDDEEDSEQESAVYQSGYPPEEGEGETEFDGEGDVEVETEAKAHDSDLERGDNEEERVQSSPEKEISDQRMESEGKGAENEERYAKRVVPSRRQEIIRRESEGSEDNHYADQNYEDEGVDETRKARSRSGHKDNVVRDVFGDSDEDEPEYGAQNELEKDSHRSPMEEDGSYDKNLRPEDIIPDKDTRYESEDANLLHKPKEKSCGLPLDLEVPLRRPPDQSDRMNMIKVSNIMGIESKPFDPKTYVEEDVFVTDESGAKKRIRLEDNIVRWRRVKNPDGRISYESNARFVKWEDGSLQLLIGNEVLDISVQEAHHDQAHLFLRHGKGMLQSQGRLLKKMGFMPSSLSSKSHRLLTALVDSQHKKVYKVKNCITDIDPEREKEERGKVANQTIRANELLHRKRERVNSKYSHIVHKGQRQLSPRFLEDTLDEDNEPEDYYNSRRAAAGHRFEDLEVEAQAEKRVLIAKRSHAHRDVPRKPSLPASRPSMHQVEENIGSETEESEYGSDGKDTERSPLYRSEEEPDHEDEYDEEQEAEEQYGHANTALEEDEEEELRRRTKEARSSSLWYKEIDSDRDSPPRKTINRRGAIIFDSDED